MSGTEIYATYETTDGYSAIYDEGIGLFCYAALVDGELVSTGVPVTADRPPEAQKHAEESAEVRDMKIQRRDAEREKNAGAPRRGRNQ